MIDVDTLETELLGSLSSWQVSLERYGDSLPSEHGQRVGKQIQTILDLGLTVRISFKDRLKIETSDPHLVLDAVSLVSRLRDSDDVHVTAGSSISKEKGFEFFVDPNDSSLGFKTKTGELLLSLAVKDVVVQATKIR